MTRATRAEWFRRVQRWRSSGLGAVEFAAREGFNANTLRWWSSRLGREPERIASFIEVAIPGVQPSRALEIVVRDGVRIRVTSGFDGDLLRQVVAALEVR